MNGNSLDAQIADEEWLTRFVLRKDWIRQDNTIRGNAFLPPQDLRLSVFGHSNISEEHLWALGKIEVAEKRQLPLLGRADLQALHVRSHALQVHPDTPPQNHSIITGWPVGKPAQKILALELAASAHYLQNPTLV